jgi:hypothetical protein
MKPKHVGLLIFISALGSFLALAAVNVSELQSWSDASSPAFVAKLMIHLATVIASYVGGRIVGSDKSLYKSSGFNKGDNIK